MLAGDIYEPRKIRLTDTEEPLLDPASPGEIIFQPELGCLCGSDLLYFEGDYAEYPPEIGHSLHEMIGRVVDTNGDLFQVGDHVLCVPDGQQGLSERFRVTERQAILVDPRPPVDQALLAQPLGTVLFALRKLPNLIDQSVVVVGQGPMGQLFNLALRQLGARQIIAVDQIGDRLEVSPLTGATETVNSSQQDPIKAVEDLTGGEGADLVVEAVGHREQVLNLCAELCRPFGNILFFGVPPQSIDNFNIYRVFWKNLSIVTSVGPDFKKDFPLAMQWIAEGRVDVSPLITHRMPWTDIQEAFDIFSQRQDGALKVFLDF
ncbi:MAG: zinc-binding dehydrogenase [Pirellulaceae bacterium]|jgi:threonine dehydrogenase-like Zn-dependent dehydrogenase|nr:zinc-binding dehydrogenase [Pirellulaceae bacterium]